MGAGMRVLAQNTRNEGQPGHASVGLTPKSVPVFGRSGEVATNLAVGKRSAKLGRRARIETSSDTISNSSAASIRLLRQMIYGQCGRDKAGAAVSLVKPYWPVLAGRRLITSFLLGVGEPMKSRTYDGFTPKPIGPSATCLIPNWWPSAKRLSRLSVSLLPIKVSGLTLARAVRGSP